MKIYYRLLTCLIILPFTCNAAVVLQYHHIDTETPQSTSTSPKLFNQHIQYLLSNNFNVVSLPQLTSQLKQKKTVADKTVAITFDDGYASVYQNAYPILKQYKLPFTLFVHTEPIESNRPSHVTWSQLIEMKKFGATIANHTHNHSHLIVNKENLTIWKDRFLLEVSGAQAIINRKLNQDVRLFAYPYGEFDNDSERLLAELGYIGFGQHSGAIGRDNNLQRLPRYPASNYYGRFPEIEVKLNSVAFENIKFSPGSGTLKSSSENPPTLSIYGSAQALDSINCFGSTVGALDKRRIDDTTLIVRAKTRFMTRRFRYNCTSKLANENRFQWISIPWVNQHSGNRSSGNLSTGNQSTGH